MDFVHDQLATEKKLRVLTVVGWALVRVMKSATGATSLSDGEIVRPCRIRFRVILRSDSQGHQ
ncbi:hypothetical protein ASD00_27340 [Ensifer sp. Root31]|nr:hypothetical protein ASD00_27340 [Ensifer sp. Root31]